MRGKGTSLITDNTSRNIYFFNEDLEINYLTDYFQNLWDNLPHDMIAADRDRKFSFLDKITNRKMFEQLIRNIFKALSGYSSKESEPEFIAGKLKNEPERIISQIMKNGLKPAIIINYEGFKECAALFLKEAMEFDKLLTDEELFQALRNVWIMNSLQFIFGLPVRLTKSVFAYSLLYPYTDNYLDDDKICISDKLKIGENLTLRLSGVKLKTGDRTEDKIYELISMIESEFCREQYPEVYKGLLLIHREQLRNNKLQNCGLAEAKEVILQSSILKGGTSVLADAYLVKGRLTKEERQFSFGLGFLLQLADDMQDAEEDEKKVYITMFTCNRNLVDKQHVSNKKNPYTRNSDDVASKLFALTTELIDNAFLYGNLKKTSNFLNVFKADIELLLMYSVAKNQKMYSMKFKKKISKLAPFNMNYMKKLDEKLMIMLEQLTAIKGKDRLIEDFAGIFN